MDDLVFEPVVLKWAREKRFGPKIETLESNLESAENISVALIKDWEAGISHPTFAQVKKLAEVYKRPLAVFFLDSPPEENSNPPDLRTIGSKDNKLLSPEVLLVMRKARRIQEISKELYEELSEKFSFKYSKYTLSDDPIKLAEKIRTDFLLLNSTQSSFKKYEDLFECLREKIENTGVITLKSGSHDSFPKEDCRAFSFTDQEPYLILINNKDTEGAKNFSIMHEFAHILLREAGICNNFKAFNENGSEINKLEVFCNKFAANFLVPADDFLIHKTLNNKKRIPMEELDNITRQLAFDFKVSRVVILRRLRTFNLINEQTYKEKTDVWENEVIHRRKPGGVFSLKTTFLKNGKKYSFLVFDAYKQKKISYSSVSDYLGLKTKHLSGFEKLLNSYAK